MIYIYIWVILVVFTIVEVLALLLPLTRTVIVLGVITLASIKAVSIASFYQHLKYEPNSLRIFPLVFLFLIVLFILLAQLIALPHAL